MEQLDLEEEIEDAVDDRVTELIRRLQTDQKLRLEDEFRLMNLEDEVVDEIEVQQVHVPERQYNSERNLSRPRNKHRQNPNALPLRIWAQTDTVTGPKTYNKTKAAQSTIPKPSLSPPAATRKKCPSQSPGAKQAQQRVKLRKIVSEKIKSEQEEFIIRTQPSGARMAWMTKLLFRDPAIQKANNSNN